MLLAVPVPVLRHGGACEATDLCMLHLPAWRDSCTVWHSTSVHFVHSVATADSSQLSLLSSADGIILQTLSFILCMCTCIH